MRRIGFERTGESAEFGFARFAGARRTRCQTLLEASDNGGDVAVEVTSPFQRVDHLLIVKRSLPEPPRSIAFNLPLHQSTEKDADRDRPRRRL